MNMNLKDYIAIYNIGNNEFCKKTIDQIKNTEWKKHSYNNPVLNKNTTYDDDFEISYQSEYVETNLMNFIKKCADDYIKNICPIPFKLQELRKIRFNKYEIGTKMKFHHDHIHTMFDGTKKGVPILTVLGLLNDDFEGGDFLMFDGKKVNLEAGDVIVFPSNFLYPHAVTTVTKGTRYSFVSWGY